MRGNAVARADFADASFIHLCLLCVAKLASASEIKDFRAAAASPSGGVV